MNLMRSLSAGLLVLMTAVPQAEAGNSYFPGTGWREFSFDAPLSGGNERNSEGEFSFTVHAGQSATLTVADQGWNNERFEVLNNGIYAGFWTSEPGPAGQTGAHWSPAPSPGTNMWSSGTWALAPGNYKLSFRMQMWSSTKYDDPPWPIYKAGFRVDVVQTPDADNDMIADQFETGTGIYVSPVNTGTDPNNTDSDGDGLDDWTEISVHSTNPTKADTDGDGFHDLAEIQAGKLPLDANSNPDAAMGIGAAVEVTLYTKAGTNYQVQWSDDLTNWTTLPEIITGDGNPVTKFYSTKDHPRRYFRATKLPPPNP